jgi:hypothetical protein
MAIQKRAPKPNETETETTSRVPRRKVMTDTVETSKTKRPTITDGDEGKQPLKREAKSKLHQDDGGEAGAKPKGKKQPEKTGAPTTEKKPARRPKVEETPKEDAKPKSEVDGKKQPQQRKRATAKGFSIPLNEDFLKRDGDSSNIEDFKAGPAAAEIGITGRQLQTIHSALLVVLSAKVGSKTTEYLDNHKLAANVAYLVAEEIFHPETIKVVKGARGRKHIKWTALGRKFVKTVYERDAIEM